MPTDFSEFTNKLRELLPAETTAAYIVGMKYYDNLSGFLPTETVQQMLFLFSGLLVLNILIYVYVRKVRNIGQIAFVTLGFILWCATVDSARAGELMPRAITFIPAFLIVYTVASGFWPKEKRK